MCEIGLSFSPHQDLTTLWMLQQHLTKNTETHPSNAVSLSLHLTARRCAAHVPVAHRYDYCEIRVKYLRSSFFFGIDCCFEIGSESRNLLRQKSCMETQIHYLNKHTHKLAATSAGQINRGKALLFFSRQFYFMP